MIRAPDSVVTAEASLAIIIRVSDVAVPAFVPEHLISGFRGHVP
jgi:hypothetical protein